jgi:anti-sigma factor RsiW
MKDSKSDVSRKHIDELCLAYVEDVLSPEERGPIEQHLESCPACAKQTEDMSSWLAFVKHNKHALCPEEWELFDYAQCNRDVAGFLEAHLEACSECRLRVQEYRSETAGHGVPEELWENMTHSSKAPEEASAEPGTSWFHRLREIFTHSFAPPLALAGAVAAAVLLVVLVYRSGPSGPFLGLSSISWAPNRTGMTLMGEPEAGSQAAEKRPRLASVVYFKDVPQPPDPDQIDATYRLLDPGRVVRSHYDVVQPSHVKEALQAAGITKGNVTEVLRILRERLSVDRVMVMTLSEQGARFTIQARLMDTATGKVMREHKMVGVPTSRLSEDVETASEAVLRPD